MKMILLMVLFSTPADPAPHQFDGFGPRVMESMEQCLARRSTLQAYITDKRPSEDIKFKALCVEFEARGYDEAVSAFKRELGKPA